MSSIHWTICFRSWCLSWLSLPLLVLWCIAVPAIAEEQAGKSFAVIETAHYQARLSGSDLVDGTLDLTVKHLGPAPAYLDWSDVRIAINELMQGDQSRVVWGTDASQKQLVRIPESLTLKGKWTLHGEQVGDRLRYNISLPPALESKLNLLLPAGYVPIVSRGLVNAAPSSDETDGDLWSLDLGKHRSVILEIQLPVSNPISALSLCEADSVHVIRRDGVYLQSDMVFETGGAPQATIELKVPRKLRIQSISSSGVQIPYERLPDQQDLISIPIQFGPNQSGPIQSGSIQAVSSNRFSIRLQGMLSTTWDRKRVLPQIQPRNATLVQQQVAVRVESPLKIMNIEPEGYIQTGLSTLPTGEVWKFNLVNRNGRLLVSTQVPKPKSKTQLDCLLDLRSQAAWGNCLLQVSSESGAQFDALMGLPAEWTVVSVEPFTAKSKVSDWNVESGQLQLHFREPATSNTPHHVLVHVLCKPFKLNEPFELQLPTLPVTEINDARFHLVLPKGYLLELLDGDAWEIVNDVPLQPELKSQLSEEILLDLNRNQIATLKTSQAVATPPTVQLIQQDLLGKEISPSIQSAAKAPDAPVTDERSSVLNLSTVLGHGNSQGIVHHAYFYFNQATPVQEIGLKLHPQARLSSVFVDDLPVTVIPDGEFIIFPSEVESASTLEVIYVTQSVSQHAIQTSQIPIPELSIPIENFEWSIKTPVDQRVTNVNLPEFIWGNRTATHPMLRFFGPLARTPDRRVFNPFSLDAWRDLLRSQDRIEKEKGEYQTVQIFSDTPVPQVELTLRNDALIRSYAWIAFLGCLLTGAGGRMFRVRFIQKSTIVWLICLGFMVTLVSEDWAIVAGGMLAGTVVSLLLPRKLVHSKDVFLRIRQRGQISPAPIATSFALLTLLGLGSQLCSEDAIPVPVPAPSYLIESVEYRLLSYSPTPEVQATFFVNLLDQDQLKKDSENLLIHLPFQGVVFQSGATCKVEGNEQPLIPTMDSSGVLVDLSRLTQTLDESNPQRLAKLKSAPIRIELAFTIRSQQASSGQPLHVAKVPLVINSSIQLPKKLQLSEYWGATITQSADQGKGLSVLSMGACGTLIPQEESTSTPVIDGVEAISVLSLSGLRIDGQTRISIKDIPPGQENVPFLLRIPNHLFVKQITGDVSRWEQTTSTNGQPVLILEWSIGVPARQEKVLLLEYILSQPEKHVKSDEKIEIPAFSLLRGVPFPHKIGIVPVPGFSAGLRDPDPSLRIIDPIEWNTLPAPSRTQPTIAFELSTPLPVDLTLQPQGITRDASIYETLTIQKQTLSWQALIQMDVGILPAFRHDFHLSPGIEVTSVVKIDDAVESPVRWTQTDHVLTLLLAEGQFGKQAFLVKGQKSFAAESWRSLPSIKPIDAKTLTSELSIEDQTYWNLELETAAGTTLKSPPQELQENKTVSRTIGVFKEGQRPPPIRLRATPPPETTQVESVSRIGQNENGQWTLSSTFVFRTTEAPLRQLQFVIPNRLSQIQVRPVFYRHVTLPGEVASELTIRLPGNTKNRLSITIDAVFSDEIGSEESAAKLPASLSMIGVKSAVETSRYLLLDALAPISLSPECGKRVPIVTLPEWTRSVGNQMLQNPDLASFLVSTDELEIVPRTVSKSGQAQIYLAETIFWPRFKSADSNSTSATTQLWLNDADAREIQIAHSDAVVIHKILQESGTSLPILSESNLCMVPLSKGNRFSALTVHWEIKQTGDTKLELLQFPEAGQTRQLAVLASTPEIQLSDLSRTVQPVEIWLSRWEALLETLESMNTSIPVDSLLLQTIRLCERNCQRLINVESRLELKDRLNELQQKWNEYRKGLIISVEDLALQYRYSPTSFSDLLGEASREVIWLEPESSAWTASLTSRRIYWLQPFTKVLLLILVTGLVLNYLNSLIKLPDQTARYPDVSLLILGVLWWLFFSPSLFGLILALSGVFLRLASIAGFTDLLAPDSLNK